MKNYYITLLVFFPAFVFGQLQPVSEFEAEFSSYNFLGIVPVKGCDEFDNIIAAHSEKDLHLFFLDKKLQLQKTQRIGDVVDDRRGYFYFQNEEYVYGVYNKKRGRSPEILRVKKGERDFKNQKALKIPRAEKVFLSFEEKGFIYILTRPNINKDIKVYRLKGLELVEEMLFENAGRYEMTWGQKVYQSNYPMPNPRIIDNSSKVFFQNGNIIFIRNRYQQSTIKTQLLSLNLESGEGEFAEYEADLKGAGHKYKVSVKQEKYMATHIIDSKLYQLVRTPVSFLLNIYDLSSKELLTTMDLAKDITEELKGTFLHSEGGTTLNQLALDNVPIFNKTFFDKSRKVGAKGSVSGIAIQKNLDGNYFLVAGRFKAQYTTTYSSGFGAGGRPTTMAHSSISGYESFFTFAELEEDGLTIKKGGDFSSKFKSYQSHIKAQKQNSKKKRKAIDVLHKMNGGYKLISFDKREKKFFIY